MQSRQRTTDRTSGAGLAKPHSDAGLEADPGSGLAKPHSTLKGAQWGRAFQHHTDDQLNTQPIPTDPHNLLAAS